MTWSDAVGSINAEILIVEDSHTQAQHLRHVLELNRYKVTIAYNGEEACQALLKFKPTIVISDVVMPEMDGYELCRRIKQNEETRKIPVILLTQLSSPHDIIKGLECGADHFITKPYNKEHLLSHLQYICVNRELRKNSMADLGIEIFFAGHKHFLTSDRIQILDLLFSTYEAVMQKNRELEQTNQRLQHSLDTIKTLGGLIPICSHCKKIRNDKGYWQQLEIYIKEHTDAEFTHGLCPECEKTIYSKYASKDDGRKKAPRKPAGQ
ncbi:response regulator [bacterium]|nr:response regulator [bacterium]